MTQALISGFAATPGKWLLISQLLLPQYKQKAEPQFVLSHRCLQMSCFIKHDAVIHIHYVKVLRICCDLLFDYIIYTILTITLLLLLWCPCTIFTASHVVSKVRGKPSKGAYCRRHAAVFIFILHG